MQHDRTTVDDPGRVSDADLTEAYATAIFLDRINWTTESRQVRDRLYGRLLERFGGPVAYETHCGLDDDLDRWLDGLNGNRPPSVLDAAQAATLVQPGTPITFDDRIG